MFWAMVCLSAAADAVELPREEDEGLAEGSLRWDCEKMLPILSAVVWRRRQLAARGGGERDRLLGRDDAGGGQDCPTS